METIFEWVRSGLLFTIISSIMILLCPNKTYIKHISLVLGLLFILVMMRPLMSIAQLDEKTYLSYIEKYLKLDGGEELSANTISLYEDALALQLKALLIDSGYAILDIQVTVRDDTTVEKVWICFSGQATQLEYLETYLHQTFGEEVKIVYEDG